ncbi:hypothetical protein [Listeria sp. ILCC792]|uniref:hypothetical protein n=1 Tax=Listeria sp. ILCC792 TaxID=1918331 RepID=UPI000B594E5F|nr:hypothetical protein [Listeria sp. ILCC792]
MSFDPMDFISDLMGFLPLIIMVGGVLLARHAKKEAESKRKAGTGKAPQSKMRQAMNEARNEYRDAMKTHSKPSPKAKPAVTSGTYTSAPQVQTTKVDVAAKKQAERARKQMERESTIEDINVTRSGFETHRSHRQKLSSINLKRAMIAKEVLDKPVSLRDHSS